KAGLPALAIHGNKSQSARQKALDAFKSGRTRILVATDVAARGLDIPALPLVINHDLPMVAEDYVHRIGRTGRNGMSGEAISLVSPDEGALLRQIQKLLKRDITIENVPGYELDRPLRLDVPMPKPSRGGKPAGQRPPRKPRGGGQAAKPSHRPHGKPQEAGAKTHAGAAPPRRRRRSAA
ncbi:RNA helicase, partial [Lysobacter pythonis]